MSNQILEHTNSGTVTLSSAKRIAMDFGETSLGVDGMAMVFNESKQWPIGIKPLVRSSGNQINKETRRQAIVVYCNLPTKNSRDKI